GRYAQKHNPFIYFNSIRLNPARCSSIVPFTQFATDLSANTLADFTWITPDMCDSEHDCSVAQGDAWLGEWVPQILASPAWQQNGALFIVYDEGTTDAGCCTLATGGHTVLLVLSPAGKPQYVSATDYDHYSLLRTIEMSWSLPLLGNAACDCSPS